jgi:hypothetical protein
LPVSAAVLVAAEEWGVPPWQIAPDALSEIEWFMRWQFYRGQVSKVKAK